jgi:hypothetical protein
VRKGGSEGGSVEKEDLCSRQGGDFTIC